jgi:2-polyprenyl-3-methyl-5-hydroxy-6-metoxy-1,4-benzoquinol methylase
MTDSKNLSDQIDDWTEVLFINNSELYLPVLESMKEIAEPEVESLCKLFEKFHIKNGSRILDFSCGIGRHSVNLAKKGFQVVGCDPSPLFIYKATSYAKQELQQDMIQNIKFYNTRIKEFRDILLHNEPGFDVIIIMDTSIGYLSEENDIDVFKDLFDLAEKGCILLLQTENRDWRIMNTPNCSIDDFGQVLINEVWNLDQSTSIAKSRSKFYRKDGDGRYCLRLELETQLRLYALHELRNILQSSGWNFLRAYGDLRTSTDITFDSPNLITISQKK